tara:strand:+ start:625 stop:3255 length:2631 start_codon:yes stop_codon:yes gene_type:complete
MSGEKKRLEQFLLQRKASNIMMVDPRYSRFQPDNMDRIRLLQAQRLAGQVPVSERLKKDQKKKKKKARKTKALRGDLARNLTEQRRFVKGERREKDTEEPRIVGDPAPVPAGFAYDPVTEKRRLDLQEAAETQRRLEVVADRREQARRQDAELAVRRGELAAGRADRALIRAAIPPPAAPIVIPPAAAPVINIAAPPAAAELPARADADPIPEIQRLGAELRADSNAFGQEQEERNRDFFTQLRDAAEFEGRQTRETLEAVEGRQQAQDENTRVALARQDALNEELQVRLGMHEVEMGRARDVIIQEIRDAEGRLLTAERDLDRPTSFDDVILAADRPALGQAPAEGTSGVRRVPIEEVDSPTPREASPDTPLLVRRPTPPTEPGGIGGVIAGGGELNLPNVVVEQPGRIGPDESLRLSPEQQSRIYPRGTAGGGPARGGGGAIRSEQAGELSTLASSEEGSTSGSSIPDLETTAQAERLQLDPVDPVNVADVLRLSRLAIQEGEADLQQEEPEVPQPRLRLTDTQDFLSGFDRPSGSPETRSQRAARNLPVREEVIESPEAIGSPVVEPSTPSTPQEEAVFEQLREQLRESSEEEPVEFLPGQDVATYVSPLGSQTGGAAGPAPDRVIEDAGIQAQPELRPLDPDVLFEAVEEAEVVGQVQDQRPQAIRDSSTLFTSAVPDLASGVRTGPRGARSRGGVGFRVRNNTDRTLKKIEPGDVVNISGVEQGTGGEGRFRLDTNTAAGTRVGMGQFAPLIDDGSLIFESGHRHELGGHFDEQPYGPPPQAPGLLQQGAEAAGGAAAAVVGGAARLAGGAALGVGQGILEQLPAAGDVGAALGRGAVAGAVGAARLAGGAVAGVVGGGEEELEQEAEDEP